MSVYLLFLNNQSKKEQIIKSANELVQTNYINTLQSFETLANTVFNGYIHNTEVKHLFKNRSRQRLYEHLEKDYDYLSSINFRQIHFHLPNNHSFLRMHQPDRYGDDLTAIRYSVKYVNENKKPISGIEMGKIIPGFRYVYPLFLKDAYLGSVEASFSVKAFIHKLEKVYDIHAHFILKNEIFDNKIFNDFRHNYNTSIEADNYTAMKLGQKKNLNSVEVYLFNSFRTELFLELQKLFQTQQTFGLVIELKDKHIQHQYKVATFLALHNLQQEHMGYFVLYQDSQEMLLLEQEFLNYIVIATIINLLFIFILYNEMTRKEGLSQLVQIKTQELLKKTQELEELNNSLEDKVKEEVEKSKHREQQLFEIEKMAQMGDMIGNIAHQWRQPLSAIATSASAIELQQELEILDEKTIKEYMQTIVRNTKYLSETIDTFRDFIRAKKEYEEVDLNRVIKNVMEIVKASMRHNQIKVIYMKTQDEIKVNTIAQELSQVLINIFNNAKDAIRENEIKDACIDVKLEQEDDKAIISIEDNAGGISKEVLPKIFDPYFTTKHKSLGTGLGLHMSRKIIHESLHGKLYAKNTKYGVKFFIELPLKG